MLLTQSYGLVVSSSYWYMSTVTASVVSGNVYHDLAEHQIQAIQDVLIKTFLHSTTSGNKILRASLSVRIWALSGFRE